eukprot:2482100-Prymnesium_polylepis.1
MARVAISSSCGSTPSMERLKAMRDFFFASYEPCAPTARACRSVTCDARGLRRPHRGAGRSQTGGATSGAEWGGRQDKMREAALPLPSVRVRVRVRVGRGGGLRDEGF